MLDEYEDFDPDELKTIAVGLNAEHLGMFQYVMDHYGFHTNSSALRFLVVQAYRAIREAEHHERNFRYEPAISATSSLPNNQYLSGPS